MRYHVAIRRSALLRRALRLGALCTVTTFSAAHAQLPPRPEPDAARSKGPALFVGERLKQIGTIVEGEVLTVTWTLENRGREQLVISQTGTSCGCTVVALSEEQKRIAPGESRPLSATFDSTGRRGEQSKTVTVYSNDPTEPEMKLEFRVNVQSLFDVNPPGIINLRMMRRGDSIQKTVELLPAQGRSAVEIQEIVTEQGAPLVFSHEPFKTDHGIGQRIQMTVGEDLPIGNLTALARVRFTVDGVAREHLITLRGEVVGDLIWRPLVLDMTRQAVTAGRTLSPVVIESTMTTPFEIIEASAGPLFDVQIETRRPSERLVTLVLKEKAPTGPFATTLRVRTDSLDQPLVSVPVFGIVAETVEVEPPLVLLRADGTNVGRHRRVKVRSLQPTLLLRPSSVSCDNPYVSATLDERITNQQRNAFVLDVTLNGDAPKGRHEATLTIGTDAEGIGVIQIPVVVDVPG